MQPASSADLQHGYRQRLEHLVEQQLENKWSSYWPEWTDSAVQIHHSQRGQLSTIDELLLQATVDLQGTTQHFCAVESITADWAAELGVAWNIEPQFFIEYLRGPDRQCRQSSFAKAQVPGSAEGLRSTHGGQEWDTMRGVIDYGKRQRDPHQINIRSTYLRDWGVTEDGRCIWHTNISFYRVHERLSMLPWTCCPGRLVRKRETKLILTSLRQH